MRFQHQVHCFAMNEHFIAIEVGQGDAFVIKRRDNFVALIDGGRSKCGFHIEFQRATNCSAVDVIVCTHNDADHANGIISYLRSGLQCKEVWLPASWTARLSDLSDPERFTSELVDNIAEFNDDQLSGISSTDAFFENFTCRHTADESDGAEREVDVKAFTERTLEEECDDYFELLCPSRFYRHPAPWLFHMLNQHTNRARLRLFINAIAAGERIRQIAQLAYHRGCRLRWFEFSSAKSTGGIPGKLIPVNAREVANVQTKKLSALMYLALTITNKQSLVFCSPDDGDTPAVLFTADSDLSFTNVVPWSHEMLVTAPHHGSETNAEAYRRFQLEIETTPTTWIRSDGSFRLRPGVSFLSLRGRKVPVFCTLCRGTSHPKQDLFFTASGQKWSPKNTRVCSCV